MNLFNYVKNRMKFLKMIEDIATEYDKGELYTCKDEIMQSAKHYANNRKEEIAEWKDFNTDYIHIAHTFILLKCNSVLEARPCIALNAGAYRHVRNQVLDWAVKHGHLTEEERNEYR